MRTTFHTRSYVGMLATLGWLAFGANLPAQTTSPSEYQIKAVFLFNFAQFVDWPATAFSDPQSPLVIGILGDDPFGAYLDETVRGEKAHDRELIIRRFRRVEDMTACHILFISRSESDDLETIFSALQDRSVLTVGDTIGFARRGGMIRMITEDKKIRLRINLDAVKAQNLVISSKLLRPAQIVATGKD